MVGRKELPSREPQEVNLPPWARNIKISYDAVCQTRDKIVEVLGTPQVSGKIDKKHEAQIRGCFIKFLDVVRAGLPESIFLGNGVVLGLSVPPLLPRSYKTSEYFIPKTNQIQIHPESNSQVGFDLMKDVGTDDIGHVLSKISDISGKGDPSREVLDNTRQEIEQMMQEWKIEWLNSRDEFTAQFKTRILNLNNSVASQFKQPRYIMVSVHSPGDDRKVCFLPKEDRLVLATTRVEKNLIGRSKQVPDLSRAEDAPIGHWIPSGYDVTMQLLNPVPRKIREEILRE